MSMDNDTTRDRVRSAALIGAKQPEAREIEPGPELNMANYGGEDVDRLNDWAIRVDAEIDILHAENESLRASFDTLRTGYDAARLEIESLKTDHMQALTAYQTTVDNLHTQMDAVGAGGMEPLRKRCLHQISEPAQPVGAVPDAQIDDLAELSMLNRLIDLGAKAAGFHAKSNSDDGHAGTAAWVQWQEARAQMGELIRSTYAAAPQPAAQALDAAFEAVRQRLCGLERYSFVLDDDGVVRRVQDRVGSWIEFDAAHELFDPVAVDAAIAAQQGGTA